MKPVVGVDIDGTIGDWYSHFFNFAEQWLGIQDSRWWKYDGSQELSDFMHLDKRTYRMIKLAYRQGGQKRLMPVKPFVRQLFSVLVAHEVEIWITTTRPYLQMGSVDEDTREWLRRNDIPYDHILYDDRKYRALLDHVERERVACVLDDQVDPEYIDAQELGLSPILVHSHFNSGKVAATPRVSVQDVAIGLEQAAMITEQRIADWSMRNGTATDGSGS